MSKNNQSNKICVYPWSPIYGSLADLVYRHGEQFWLSMSKSIYSENYFIAPTTVKNIYHFDIKKIVDNSNITCIDGNFFYIKKLLMISSP